MKLLMMLALVMAVTFQAEAKKINRIELCETFQEKAETKCNDEITVYPESESERRYKDPYGMDSTGMSDSEMSLYMCIDSKIKNQVKYYNSKSTVKLNCNDFLTFGSGF